MIVFKCCGDWGWTQTQLNNTEWKRSLSEKLLFCVFHFSNSYLFPSSFSSLSHLFAVTVFVRGGLWKPKFMGSPLLCAEVLFPFAPLSGRIQSVSGDLFNVFPLRRAQAQQEHGSAAALFPQSFTFSVLFHLLLTYTAVQTEGAASLFLFLSIALFSPSLSDSSPRHIVWVKISSYLWKPGENRILVKNFYIWV